MKETVCYLCGKTVSKRQSITVAAIDPSFANKEARVCREHDKVKKAMELMRARDSFSQDLANEIIKIAKENNLNIKTPGFKTWARRHMKEQGYPQELIDNVLKRI